MHSILLLLAALLVAQCIQHSRGSTSASRVQVADDDRDAWQYKAIMDVAGSNRHNQPVVAPGHQLLFCAVFKNGSTEWLKLVQLLNGATAAEIAGKNPHDEHVLRLGELDQALVVSEPTWRRVFLTRNPYVRILSGFMDKIERGDQHAPHYYRQLGFHAIPTFAAFVAALLQRSRTAGIRTDVFEVHFALQTSWCGYDRGFQYNHILKVEETCEWIRRIARELGVLDTMMHDWSSLLSRGGESCFYHPPGADCSWLSADPEDKSGSDSCGIGDGASEHSTGALSHMSAYYTPELARAVSEIYRDDFEAFGYAHWAGPPEAFVEA